MGANVNIRDFNDETHGRTNCSRRSSKAKTCPKRAKTKLVNLEDVKWMLDASQQDAGAVGLRMRQKVRAQC
jgi:hypothetical protein